MNPLDMLACVSKDYSKHWKMVDQLRSERGVELQNWPGWCFLPLVGWYFIICKKHKVDKISLELSHQIGILSAIGTWRYSQGIYRFDNEIYKSIIETNLSGKLPSEIFFRLPQWCVYIETPGMNLLDEKIHGFWCHLEWDERTKKNELRLLINSNLMMNFAIHIGNFTLEESIDSFLNQAADHANEYGSSFNYPPDTAKNLAKQLQGIICLVIYLCSDEPEIVDREEPLSKPKNPTTKKVKSGMRMFPPDKPKIFDVGKNTGEKLREYYKNYDTISDGKRTVKPHLRKAHWHGYWTGAIGSEERTFKYNWLHPVFVSSRKIKEIK